jgi:hypothetical protein
MFQYVSGGNARPILAGGISTLRLRTIAQMGADVNKNAHDDVRS